ncbi:MAG: restriction endonuclease subunit S [Desulfobacteria bacterium]
MIGASRMAFDRDHLPTYGWPAEPPRGWPVLRLRFCAAVNPSRSEVNGLQDDTEVSFVPMEAVSEYGGLRLDQTRSLADVATGYTYFREGDVVVAKITPCFENGKGSIADGLTNGLGFGTTELHVLRPLASLDREFLFYLTISHPFRSIGAAYMYGAGGQKRVPDDFVRDFRHPIPPLDEQGAIVAFLNRETARIDALIEKKCLQIELLNEKRATLISHAVTKGLDPDAPMKDSGIEWLGDIPKHWKIRKLKHIASVQFSNVDKNSVEGEETVRLCNYVDVYNNDFITGNLAFMSATATKAEIRKFAVQRGDVIITKDSESWTDIAVPSYVSDELEGVLCGYHLAQIRANTRLVDGKYLFRAFASKTINHQFQVASTGVTRYGLGNYWLENGLIMVPPLPEQLTIAAILDGETARIDSLVEKVRQSIERLREYRTALISAAVTGKIDVGKEVA